MTNVCLERYGFICAAATFVHFVRFFPVLYIAKGLCLVDFSGKDFPVRACATCKLCATRVRVGPFVVNFDYYPANVFLAVHDVQELSIDRT